MVRPLKEDRDAVRTSVLTIKLSAHDRALLGRLAESRAEELRKLTGQTIDVSLSGLLRWVVEAEAARRGIVSDADPEEPAPDAVALQKRLEAVLAKGMSSVDIARAAGIDPAGLARFRRHRKGLSATLQRALEATLAKLARKGAKEARANGSAAKASAT
jgi:hypothetical protein